ncbi:type III pantothenate kinase [Methylophilus sp. Leaf414]|uniref:type III pantothenate kinase n=1 Tax=Methylophilus sp. Leaf414 TaxID=1736371 RepID=UPI0006F83B8D|nr:type III pantothenate kinase [Methylophilus sp. Leaf414]KQT34135.1 type III pantothenate kinase [Methylophilus sp. Leaf414]
MKLLIDAGNTRTKWAWFPDRPWALDMHLQMFALENQQWLNDSRCADSQALHAAIVQADEVWVSNVAGAEWQQSLDAVKEKVTLIKASPGALGLNNSYGMPAQLGSDRWCSLLAVWRLHKQDALVVTAGTAMTMDALVIQPDAEERTATFAGGSIQPGLNLMWQSLQQGTAQLDYEYPHNTALANGFARNSQQAMWAGCVQALIAPMTSQFIELQSMTDGRQPALVLSGGDAVILQRYLPDALSLNAIIVDNLVLKGLACLAEST